MPALLPIPPEDKTMTKFALPKRPGKRPDGRRWTDRQLAAGVSAGRDPAPVAVGVYLDGQEKRISFWCAAGKAPTLKRAQEILESVCPGGTGLARIEVELAGEVIDHQILT